MATHEVDAMQLERGATADHGEVTKAGPCIKSHPGAGRVEEQSVALDDDLAREQQVIPLRKIQRDMATSFRCDRGLKKLFCRVYGDGPV